MTLAVKRLIGVFLALALVASMVFITAEPAQTKGIKTKVTFKTTDRTVKPDQKILFFGKVKSKKKKCEKRRKVVLKRRGTGKVDTDRSDGEGEYRFRLNPEPDLGTYFVKVKKKKIRVRGYGYGYGGKKKRKCKKAISRDITIRPVA
jgi:hypothetical protein